MKASYNEILISKEISYFEHNTGELFKEISVRLSVGFSPYSILTNTEMQISSKGCIILAAAAL